MERQIISMIPAEPNLFVVQVGERSDGWREEGEPPRIYLGKDFEEARAALEKRRETYIDAYWGDAFKR